MINQEVWWTFDLVEERLIEAMQLWHRSPGDGCWPFASDGPWHLLTRETRASAGALAMMDLWRGEQEEAKLRPDARPLPLTRDDVARRDQASDWLAIVPARDRQLVVVALAAKARGDGRVKWDAIWKAGGKGRPGPEGLQMRYRRAISTICRHLNMAENRERGVSSCVLKRTQNKAC